MTSASMLPPDKDWLDAFEAIATPSTAALAAYFAWLAYRLERRRRKDELFDKRMDFLDQAWAHVISVISGIENGNEQQTIWNEVSLERSGFQSFVKRSEFLFGPEIKAFLANPSRWESMRLPRERERRADTPPPDWFVRPFAPFLKLEK